MKMNFIKQVIILALLISFVGLIHIWDLPKNLFSVSSDREPSSIEPVMKKIGNMDSTIEKIVDVETREIDCQNITDLHVKNLGLRLEGKCIYQLENIVNKTNGYTASVFNREKSFTTDYISLSVGKNFIQFSYKNDKNQDITRQLPVFVTE
jgi:hypothetical protein